MTGRIQRLFNIRYPIVQAGMVWCSGWRLASAVSNAGGLGLIGSGSMHPETLREHIQKCKAATTQSFGVNVPLLYPEIEKLMEIIADEKVKIVFTSAGNPTTWTNFLKDKGIIVVHVVSNTRFARKSVEAGVDAIVAEGFEAGGHNGRGGDNHTLSFASGKRCGEPSFISSWWNRKWTGDVSSRGFGCRWCTDWNKIRGKFGIVRPRKFQEPISESG